MMDSSQTEATDGNYIATQFDNLEPEENVASQEHEEIDENEEENFNEIQSEKIVEMKADDEGEYQSDTEMKNDEMKYSSSSSKPSKEPTSPKLKEKGKLKREHEDENNKQLKENEEPNSKKMALEHLRNMNFNKKDPFSQLGLNSRTMNFSRVVDVKQQYSGGENFEINRQQQQRRLNEISSTKSLSKAVDIEKGEEKRGTRSFLPQNDTKNLIVGSTLVKNHQLSSMTKSIVNYQGPFKQKVDNLLTLSEEQVFRLPEQDLSALLLYILDTYQEQDKLLTGRKAQLKELDQMIQKERSHVENIGMDLPPPYYSNLLEELRNINNDKTGLAPPNYSNLYNNGMPGSARNGILPTQLSNIPPTQQQQHLAGAGPINSGLPDFRMPPPQFSENSSSQIPPHAYSNPPPPNLSMPPPNFQLQQPPLPQLNSGQQQQQQQQQPIPLNQSLSQPPPTIINQSPLAGSINNQSTLGSMNQPPPSAMTQPHPSISMAAAAAANNNNNNSTSTTSSDSISTSQSGVGSGPQQPGVGSGPQQPLLLGVGSSFNNSSLSSFTSKPPPSLLPTSSSAMAASIPMLFTTPPPSLFSSTGKSPSNVISQKATITIANTSVPPPNVVVSTSLANCGGSGGVGGIPMNVMPTKPAGPLTAPPPPINFSLPPPSTLNTSTINNNNNNSTEGGLNNEPTLSSSKSLNNLGSLVTTVPPPIVSLQRPSSATLSQPPPSSSMNTTNFSVPPPQLNAPPPNLSAPPPSFNSVVPSSSSISSSIVPTTVDVTIPPPNLVMKAAMAVAGAVTNLLSQPPPSVVPNLKHPPPLTTGLFANSPDMSSMSPSLIQTTVSSQQQQQRPLPLMSLEQQLPTKFVVGQPPSARANQPNQVRSLASVVSGNLNRQNPTKSISKLVVKSETNSSTVKNQFIKQQESNSSIQGTPLITTTNIINNNNILEVSPNPIITETSTESNVIVDEVVFEPVSSEPIIQSNNEAIEEKNQFLEEQRSMESSSPTPNTDNNNEA